MLVQTEVVIVARFVGAMDNCSNADYSSLCISARAREGSTGKKAKTKGLEETMTYHGP